jgi:Resolvase, N terminal domain
LPSSEIALAVRKHAILPSGIQARGIPCNARSLPSGFHHRADHGKSGARAAGGCRARRLTNHKNYKDHGISGAKGREKRTAFDALCHDATKRQFDVVMAWSVDRLGRSLPDLVGFLSELLATGIDLFQHRQGIGTNTPGGQKRGQTPRPACDCGQHGNRNPWRSERAWTAWRAQDCRAVWGTVQRISRPFDVASVATA